MNVKVTSPTFRSIIDTGSGTDCVLRVMDRLSMPLLVLKREPIEVFPEKNPNSIGPPVEEKFGPAGPGPGRAKPLKAEVKSLAVKPVKLKLVQLDWLRLSNAAM